MAATNGSALWAGPRPSKAFKLPIGAKPLRAAQHVTLRLSPKQPGPGSGIVIRFGRSVTSEVGSLVHRSGGEPGRTARHCPAALHDDRGPHRIYRTSRSPHFRRPTSTTRRAVPFPSCIVGFSDDPPCKQSSRQQLIAACRPPPFVCDADKHTPGTLSHAGGMHVALWGSQGRRQGRSRMGCCASCRGRCGPLAALGPKPSEGIEPSWWHD